MDGAENGYLSGAEVYPEVNFLPKQQVNLSKNPVSNEPENKGSFETGRDQKLTSKINLVRSNPRTLSGQIPEPVNSLKTIELEIPEPQIPEPKRKVNFLPEVKVNLLRNAVSNEPENDGGRDCEINLFERNNQSTNSRLIFDDGDNASSEFNIDSDEAFNEHTKLWNTETYHDRHGKKRLRRVLRFCKKPIKRDLGRVTEKHEGELRNRRGRGRWGTSRAEAKQYRYLIDRIAIDFDAAKRRGSNNSSIRESGRAGFQIGRDSLLPGAPSDFPEAPPVSPLLM